MLIGELSAKTGVSRDTIRFYEKMGLIAIGRKSRRDNNYKEYSESNFNKLMAIKTLKGFGFTLNEIKALIQLWEVDALDCTEGKEKVLQKISVIEEKIRQLHEVKNRLLRSVLHCPAHCDIKLALSSI